MTERKVHCVASMKAAIPTSKLTRGLLHFCVETIGLALFLQQEHRVQQAQGTSPRAALQPAAHFLSRSCLAIVFPDLSHKPCLLPSIASNGRRFHAGPTTQAALTTQNKYSLSRLSLQHAPRYYMKAHECKASSGIRATPCPAGRPNHCRCFYLPLLNYKQSTLTTATAASYW